MEDKMLNQMLDDFYKMIETNRFIFPETEYAKIAQYFRRESNIPTAEGRDKLYKFLCGHGHFQKMMPPCVFDKFEKLIEYRNTHLAPLEWLLTDEDYVKNVSHLYDEIKAILPFDDPSIELITRIISVLYGCIPTFDATLYHLWGIDENAPFEAQLFQLKGIAVSSFIWVVFALTSASTKYTLSDNMREKVDEVNGVIYNVLRRKRKEENVIMFNTNSTNL